MEENPALAKDMNYGVPKLYAMTFEQFLQADAYGEEYEESESGSSSEEEEVSQKLEIIAEASESPV